MEPGAKTGETPLRGRKNGRRRHIPISALNQAFTSLPPEETTQILNYEPTAIKKCNKPLMQSGKHKRGIWFSSKAACECFKRTDVCSQTPRERVVA